MKVVVIEWKDACTQEEVEHVSGISEHCHMISCGLLVGETAHAIQFTQDIDVQDGSMRHTMSIPKCNIIKLTKFGPVLLKGVKRPKRRKKAPDPVEKKIGF